ncbi:MAG: hypothetical protein AB1540_08890 [Bdellovibrionota bacterium]
MKKNLISLIFQKLLALAIVTAVVACAERQKDQPKSGGSSDKQASVENAASEAAQTELSAGLLEKIDAFHTATGYDIVVPTDALERIPAVEATIDRLLAISKKDEIKDKAFGQVQLSDRYTNTLVSGDLYVKIQIEDGEKHEKELFEHLSKQPGNEKVLELRNVEKEFEGKTGYKVSYDQSVYPVELAEFARNYIASLRRLIMSRESFSKKDFEEIVFIHSSSFVSAKDTNDFGVVKLPHFWSEQWQLEFLHKQEYVDSEVAKKRRQSRAALDRQIEQFKIYSGGLEVAFDGESPQLATLAARRSVMSKLLTQTEILKQGKLKTILLTDHFEELKDDGILPLQHDASVVEISKYIGETVEAQKKAQN